jgi:hypothetical protein
MSDHNKLCQQYLEIVYFDIAKLHSKTNKRITETQGEILYSGIDKLLSIINLTEQDVFVDLGSGNGKIVLQVFLRSIVAEAIGIEILPNLHQQALLATEKIKIELPGFFVDNRKVNFILGSFFEESFSAATVILINAVCFSQDMLCSLGDKINLMPGVRLVASLRPIPTLKRLAFKKAIRIACSWDMVMCYLYY